MGYIYSHKTLNLLLSRPCTVQSYSGTVKGDLLTMDTLVAAEIFPSRFTTRLRACEFPPGNPDTYTKGCCTAANGKRFGKPTERQQPTM